MAKRFLVFTSLAFFATRICASDSPLDTESCDTRIAAYAAAALAFYRDALNAREIPGHPVEGRSYVDATFGYDEFVCQLPGTGFEELVDFEVVILDRDDIIALGPGGFSPRHFRFVGFQELDSDTYDVGVGTYKVDIHDYWNLHHVMTDEGPGLGGAACQWTVWIVDEDQDGVVDYVRHKPGSNGICT